ncbi:hypothetical protein HPB48_004933 [Haemaphysalis longicornis]|uniref:guanylate cyclase n=1 Tax=Haemaphysalis longicornis TaxID=44386 RepID=A0A9J6GFR6_HAELO|nr:hypothetical protein HPB48_004933 [Haemaphysalis longicornis]
MFWFFTVRLHSLRPGGSRDEEVWSGHMEDAVVSVTLLATVLGYPTLTHLSRCTLSICVHNSRREKSGITMHGASFLMHKVYTDDMTLKLVAAACEVLGLDLDTCLEAFGEHFLYFCQQHGYDHILRVLGSNMADFLTNLDNLHDHLASTYPGMRAPSFRVTPGPWLHPIVLGIVKVVGKEFFNTEVRADISVVSEFGDRAHVTLEITEQNKEGKSCLLPSHASETLSNRPEDLPMGVRTMCAAFPFHVLFGRDFGIVQAGKGLLRLAGHLWKESRARGRHLNFDDIFEITRPVIDCTFESIRSYCNQVRPLLSPPLSKSRD